MTYWKAILRESITRLEDLFLFLELDEKNKKEIFTNKKFPLLLPKRLADKIQKNNLEDPIFRQFVPITSEQNISEQFSCDPVQDILFKKTSHLLHKYSHRVLIVTTQACAMHCRYCFRQNFSYEKNSDFFDELKIIKEDTSLKEVILSGGDPLSLPDDKIKNLITSIEDIDHIKIIRFHTRFLIGIPERVDDEFINILRSCKKQIIFVIHVNHPIELDSVVKESIKKLQLLGIKVLCQTVLLKGVNDDLDTLTKLCWSLIEIGVMPYYLHQLDYVQGAMHFKVEALTGLNLVEQLREILPGYAVFKYVKEIPKEKSKTPLSEKLITSDASI